MVVDKQLQDAKDHLFQFMNDKEKIEAEIQNLKEILNANHIGMDESLIDNEGYPRQDIDVYQVRYARHKIICLTNDHKELMKKIEDGLHKVHALSKDQTCDSIATSCNTEVITSMEPFLIVNFVAPGSPAELAGIHIKDCITEFGSINFRNFRSLKDIAGLVENSRYKTIDVKIKRGSNVISLNLVPKPWSGKGLLGCKIIPLEIVER